MHGIYTLKRALQGFTLLLVAGLGAYVAWLAVPRHDYFLDRAGTLATADARPFDDARGRHTRLQLVSTSGLEVDMRILRPADTGNQKLPALLMLGGYRTGKDAVDRVGTPDGVVLAAIDYPYRGKPSTKGAWEGLRAVPHVQRATLDAPAALSLAASWLAAQPWVDPQRIELVGVSLGVPFAAAAGAVDPRFSKVWLLHGGGDNVSWADHAGREEIENATLRRLVARLLLLAIHGNSFDTPAWVRRTAPRPVTIVLARDDDYVSPEAQAPLVALAEEDHVELVWTDGQHIRGGRNAELSQLLDIVLGRVGAARSE